MPEHPSTPSSDPAAQAAEALREIEALGERTRRASAAALLGPCLMLCGLSWLLTLLSAEFLPDFAWFLSLLIGLGCGGGILWRIFSQGKAGLVLSEQALRSHRRTLVFWLFLFAHGLAIAWVCGLDLDRPEPVILTVVLLSMLGFITTGLFNARRELILIGGGLSALSLLGWALLPLGWFLPWTALVVGLGLMGCGHHIWKRWA